MTTVFPVWILLSWVLLVIVWLKVARLERRLKVPLLLHGENVLDDTVAQRHLNTLRCFVEKVAAHQFSAERLAAEAQETLDFLKRQSVPREVTDD